MLQALIFDVDGTLADTERHGHRIAANLAFRDVGLDWHWNEASYGQLLGVTGGKERIRHFIATHHRDFAPPNQETLDHFVTRLHEIKNRHFADMVKGGHIAARPGVARLLKEARQEDLKLAIATTSAEENVILLLETLFGRGAATWFEVIAAGDKVPRKKPAPDVYHYVLKQLGFRPQACLAIEDSEDGLRAALAAGIPTIVSVNPYTRNQDFTGAMLVVERLEEHNRPLRVISVTGDVNLSTRLTTKNIRDIHSQSLRQVAEAKVLAK